MYLCVQKLVSERNERISQVDELRDAAVELINRSSKHAETVELELTAFNQRWQDIDTRVKVFPFVSVDHHLSVLVSCCCCHDKPITQCLYGKTHCLELTA